MEPININIRPETPADWTAIRQVHQQAFGQPAEADLVVALREQGYSRISLVAERAENVIGHILFSEMEIVSSGRRDAALALAPMAVLPEYQRRGIGSKLVQFGLQHCRQQGHQIVIVVGHPGYYPRFGFSADLAAPLQSPYAGEAFMAMELVPGALAELTGEVKYSPPFEGL